MERSEFDVRRRVGYGARVRIGLERAEIRVNQDHCISPVPAGQLYGLWRCLRRRDFFFGRVHAELLAHHEQRGGLLGAVTRRLQVCRRLLLLLLRLLLCLLLRLHLLLLRLRLLLRLLLLRLRLLLRLQLGPDLLPFLLRRDRSHLCLGKDILEALVFGLCLLRLCALIYHLRQRICKRIRLRQRQRLRLRHQRLCHSSHHLERLQRVIAHGKLLA